jgi:hypothetical protein
MLWTICPVNVPSMRESSVDLIVASAVCDLFSFRLAFPGKPANILGRVLPSTCRRWPSPMAANRLRSRMTYPQRSRGLSCTLMGRLLRVRSSFLQFRASSQRLRCFRAADFKYIAGLRASNERAARNREQKRSSAEVSLNLVLTGHLFDKQVINTVGSEFSG